MKLLFEALADIEVAKGHSVVSDRCKSFLAVFAVWRYPTFGSQPDITAKKLVFPNNEKQPRNSCICRNQRYALSRQARDGHGGTPLHKAAGIVNKKGVEQLIEMRANVNATMAQWWDAPAGLQEEHTYGSQPENFQYEHTYGSQPETSIYLIDLAAMTK